MFEYSDAPTNRSIQFDVIDKPPQVLLSIEGHHNISSSFLINTNGYDNLEKDSFKVQVYYPDKPADKIEITIEYVITDCSVDNGIIMEIKHPNGSLYANDKPQYVVSSGTQWSRIDLNYQSNFTVTSTFCSITGT